MPNPLTRQIILPDFSSVPAAGGGRATLNVPIGPRYHNIWIEHIENGSLVNQATMDANVVEVEVKANGVTQREASAAQMNKLYGFRSSARNGYSFQAGMLPIFFSEPWRELPEQEDALAWGTADLQTLQIEVELASGLANAKLAAFAEVDDVRAPLEGIVKWARQTLPVTATGPRTEVGFPKTRGSYMGVHFFETSDGDITAIEFEPDSAKAYNLTRARAEAIMSSHGYTPQTGVFHVPFDIKNRITQALPMRRQDGNLIGDLRWELTMGAAQDVTAFFELLGNPD